MIKSNKQLCNAHRATRGFASRPVSFNHASRSMFNSRHVKKKRNSGSKTLLDKQSAGRVSRFNLSNNFIVSSGYRRSLNRRRFCFIILRLDYYLLRVWGARQEFLLWKHLREYGSSLTNKRIKHYSGWHASHRDHSVHDYWQGSAQRQKGRHVRTSSITIS